MEEPNWHLPAVNEFPTLPNVGILFPSSFPPAVSKSSFIVDIPLSPPDMKVVQGIIPSGKPKKLKDGSHLKSKIKE